MFAVDTGTVLTGIAVPGDELPGAVAVAPDGGRVYVTAGDVVMIDTASRTIAGRVAVATGETLGDIALAPDGRAYVTVESRDNVVVLDTSRT